MLSRLNNGGIITGLSVSITDYGNNKNSKYISWWRFWRLRRNEFNYAPTPGNGFERHPGLIGGEHTTPSPSYEPGFPKGDFSTPIIIDRAVAGSLRHGDVGRSIAYFCSTRFSRLWSSLDSLTKRKMGWQNCFRNDRRKKTVFLEKFEFPTCDQ